MGEVGHFDQKPLQPRCCNDGHHRQHSLGAGQNDQTIQWSMFPREVASFFIDERFCMKLGIVSLDIYCLPLFPRETSIFPPYLIRTVVFLCEECFRSKLEAVSRETSCRPLLRPVSF
jgi:hypothetical protein